MMNSQLSLYFYYHIFIFYSRIVALIYFILENYRIIIKVVYCSHIFVNF